MRPELGGGNGGLSCDALAVFPHATPGKRTSLDYS